MSNVGDAAERLRVAVADAVDGPRVTTDVMAAITPPAVIIGPPDLQWSTYCQGPEPDGATFPVIVAAPADDRTMERLWELVPAVTAALESVPDVTVATAKPRPWTSADKTFPAYEITASVALGE